MLIFYSILFLTHNVKNTEEAKLNLEWINHYLFFQFDDNHSVEKL